MCAFGHRRLWFGVIQSIRDCDFGKQFHDIPILNTFWTFQYCNFLILAADLLLATTYLVQQSSCCEFANFTMWGYLFLSLPICLSPSFTYQFYKNLYLSLSPFSFFLCICFIVFLSFLFCINLFCSFFFQILKNITVFTFSLSFFLLFGHVTVFVWLKLFYFILIGSRYRKVHSFGMVIFEIRGVGASDYGTYICTATNKFGTATSKFELKSESQLVEQRPKFTSQLQVNISGLNVNKTALLFN